MSQHDRLALAGRIRRNRIGAVAAVVLLLVAAFFWFRSPGHQRHKLRMSAGDLLGRRHELATFLSREARSRRLEIELSPASGSLEALARVDSGDLDAALVQGDLGTKVDSVRQVAVLVSEPLHLFVKPELLAGGPAALRGKRLNLSTPESGTHKIARQTLEFIGLASGDYVEQQHKYSELVELSADDLPDAVFAVSPLPWNLGESLVKDHGYRLMPLPFGEAMALRDNALHDMIIPAYSYSVDPPVPPEPLPTVATRLLVVAGVRTSEDAVLKLLESIFETDFAQLSDLPSLDPKDVAEAREFPLHSATVTYLNRNEPLVTGEVIESVENLRSFLVSGALATFIIWRWYSRRRMIGFEQYFDAVSEIEDEAITLDREGRLDLAELRRLRGRLSGSKAEALERYAEGRISGEEQMLAFLAHVGDVRNCLESLFAHASRTSNRGPEQT